MKAMIIDHITDLREDHTPLQQVERPVPTPGDREILVRVATCGVCHTEMDEIEGRTPPPRFPVIPGHQIVGRVEKSGPGANRFQAGVRVGIAWIHSACGHCRFCREGRENLCRQFQATGRDADGGYAEYTTVHEDYAYPVPDALGDLKAAPLLCAGAVGYRSLRLTGIEDGDNLGLTGFGASAHLVITMARHRFPGSKIFVFSRNEGERQFARELGAHWAGAIDATAPEKLRAIIDTTPVWKPIVESMRNLDRGGRLVINAIGKENTDIDYLTRIDYPEHLWLEKEIKSVANVTRQDVSECLRLAAEIPLEPRVTEFSLEQANEALAEFKQGKARGAKVLRIH
jgi:propanol-preferring alcohol dehydrogenase